MMDEYAFGETPDGGRRMDQDFSKEEWRFKAKAISSEFAPKIIDLINTADLSKSCKINLIDIVNVSFDPNAMLARNESINQRILLLKIQLNLVVASFDVSDTQNPTLMNIIEAIETGFVDFVSPSLMGKERDRVGKSSYESTTHYSGLPSQDGQQQEQRGFRAPWRR